MCYYIDCAQCYDREDLYPYLQETLHLPSYMGHNLDALWDAMNDQAPMEIVLEDARFLLDHLDDYGRLVLDLFGDLDQETDHQVIMKW